MARLMVGEVACAVWVGNKAAAVETLCMIKKVGLQRIQLLAQAQLVEMLDVGRPSPFDNHCVEVAGRRVHV